MSTNKVLLGVLAGVAAGAVVGILFAPEKGSRTRRNLVRKGEESIDDMKDKFDDLLESFTDKVECAKDDLEELISKGKSRYEAVKKEVKM